MTDDKTKKFRDARENGIAEAEAGPAEFELEERAEADMPIAYIRPVSKAEVEGALPPGAPEGVYFALHDADGRPLALFSDENAAWLAARANNLQPMTLH